MLFTLKQPAGVHESHWLNHKRLRALDRVAFKGSSSLPTASKAEREKVQLPGDLLDRQEGIVVPDLHLIA